MYFGGKASNFYLLERAIPDAAPDAIAFSFDLWDAFMDRLLDGGTQTVREAIAEILAPYDQFPVADPEGLDDALRDIRRLIRSASFGPSEAEAIRAALEVAGFDPHERIRFRSSTNVEDTELFTGAGLYDSYSGCFADDWMDDDDEGPSQCATEREREQCAQGVDLGVCEERGVLRAVRRVFSSFYNYNAFAERRHWQVREDTVGMAVLVHRSFPDERELANGVVTFEKSPYSGYQYKIVTQTGAFSVAEPAEVMLPEVVDASLYMFGTADFEPQNFYPTVSQTSTGPIPTGTTVLRWDTDYVELARQLFAVAQAFEVEHPGLETYGLDFEFKKVREEGLESLVVKQVRRLPVDDPDETVVPVLMDQESRFCVQQGEGNNVFATHRLKSNIQLRLGNVVLTEENRAATVLSDETRVVMVDPETGGELVPAGAPSSWVHEGGDRALSDTFRVGDADVSLGLFVPDRVPASQTPIVLPRDLRPTLSAGYDRPRLRLNYLDQPEAVFEERVELTTACPDQLDRSAVFPVERRIESSDGVVVEVAYVYPQLYSDIIIKTYPLGAWDQVSIRGLTTEPIVLENEASRSFEPGHHNFYEVFLFEPRFGALTPTQLQELEDADVRQLLVRVDGSSNNAPKFWFVGADGSVRSTLASVGPHIAEATAAAAADVPYGQLCP